MWKRMIVMLIVIAGLIGGLGFVKFRQIQEAMAQAAAFQPPPEAVTTIIAQQEKWPATLSAIGTDRGCSGRHGERGSPGHRRSDRISNLEHPVHDGDVLVQLDTKQEQAQLAQQQPEANVEAFASLRV